MERQDTVELPGQVELAIGFEVADDLNVRDLPIGPARLPLLHRQMGVWLRIGPLGLPQREGITLAWKSQRAGGDAKSRG